jgi:glycerol-3-phosphate dehydrogenase (NAD(P)+)
VERAVNTALRISVLGAGNWGTALAHLIASNGHTVRLWTREPRKLEEINSHHTNQRALPGLALAPTLRAVDELDAALAATELIFIALPSQAFRGVCRQLGEFIRPEQLVVHGIKGLESESHQRMSQVLLEETCVRQFGVLAGPNIAVEIAAGKPAGTVIATRFPRVSALARRALSCAQLRVFESHDVCGVELCGALKNVVAIAAGMADQLQLGDNAKAFLITRGLSELMRLALALGAEPATTAGLAGIGDLMVTCASPHSRNHRIGMALARGTPLSAAVRELGMVAEGVYAARSVRELARAHGLQMPLFEHIDRVLHEELPVSQALATLLELPTGRDVPRWLGTR